MTTFVAAEGCGEFGAGRLGSTGLPLLGERVGVRGTIPP